MDTRRPLIRRFPVALASLGMVVGILPALFVPSSARADVSGITAHAYGYSTNISLLGGPFAVRGFGQTIPPGTTESASPSVECPATGAAPNTVTDSDGARAMYGPAAVFSGLWLPELTSPPPSGPLTVSCQGTLGPAGSATSSADVLNVGPGPFLASEVHSTCTATESGLTGNTTIIGGVLETSYSPTLTTEPIPINPPVNYTRTGITSAGDGFRIVLNEQIAQPEGSLTVNAVHLYLLGPTAVGDIIIASSSCGVTITQATTTIGSSTTSSSSSSTSTSTTTSSSTTSSTTTTVKASPTISTQASPGTMLGGPVHDVATLAGGNQPTGTVTFRLFDSNTCTNQVFTSTNALSGLTATSGSFTPTVPGTYYWTARYDGDGSNNPAASGCNAPNESVTVTPFVAPPPTGTLSGDIAGPVTVGAGQSVVVTAGSRVVGPITVGPGGSLTIVGARVSRGIVVDNPIFLSICGSDLSGPAPATALSVSNAQVPIRIGDPATGCARNRIAGQVNLNANLAVTFGANFVSHNATVTNGGPGATVIKANIINGSLNCSGNNPPPTNAGQPNTAASRTGQCAGL